MRMRERAGRCAGAALVVALAVLGGCERREPTPQELLRTAWEAYKPLYIAPEGYVLDRTRGDGEAISEGQGYALLRAVWMCDEPTFDRLLAWTERNLRRPDGLYSWRWSASSSRLLDANTATDADQEIAFALVLGSHAFRRPELRERARDLLIAIRRHTGIDVPGGWFPSAGNWAVGERIVNLSYFLPYAYPDFAAVDPDGGWDRVTAIGYALLAAAVGPDRSLLPPDFMVVAPDGSIAPLPGHSELSRDFSFDAMRLYFRVALDCALYGRAEACAGPLQVGPLVDLLRRDGAIFTRYTVAGRPLTADESLSFYGSILPLLARQAPETARRLRSAKMSWAQLRPVLRTADRYYDLNWVWFGIAAAEGLLRQGERLTCEAVSDEDRERAAS
ncbi:MAG: glycosyl hydrolase family 8 [Thermodesulfobacteriota bacterium]